MEFLQRLFREFDAFHPDWALLTTVAIFIAVMIIAIVASFRYARKRFMLQLKEGVDNEVQRITTHLEKKLRIDLTSEPNGNGSHA